MKVLSFIFACWMLYIACLPCGDRQDCSVSKQTTTFSATTDHQQHEQDLEHCAPFCSCSCCASSTVSQAVTSFIVEKPSFGKMPYADYRTPMFSNISFSIWQPPRA